MRSFGDQLREAMGEMSQERLSELSGVPQTTISRQLLNRTLPRIDVVEAYERVLPELRAIRDRDRQDSAREVGRAS